jgi:hypothetical protein
MIKTLINYVELFYDKHNEVLTEYPELKLTVEKELKNCLMNIY